MKSQWQAFACGDGCYQRPTHDHAQLEHAGLLALLVTIFEAR